MGQSEARQRVGSSLPGAVGPGSEQERPVGQGSAHHELGGDLELEADPETTDGAGRLGAPFVSVKSKPGRRHGVGEESLSLVPIVSAFGSNLLQDGQDEQVRGVVPRKLVRSAEVPGRSRPISGSDDEAPSSLQNAWLGRSLRAHIPCRGDRFRRESAPVLKVVEARRGGTEGCLGRGRTRLEQNQGRKDDGREEARRRARRAGRRAGEPRKGEHGEPQCQAALTSLQALA